MTSPDDEPYGYDPDNNEIYIRSGSDTHWRDLVIGFGAGLNAPVHALVYAANVGMRQITAANNDRALNNLLDDPDTGGPS
jgi:hypothetical protein